MAIIDVCNVANRRVDILSPSDIELACEYFSIGDRSYVKRQDLESSFQYAASGYLTEHEGRISQLKLVRKLEHIMLKNGQQLSHIFDEIVKVEGDADHVHFKGREATCKASYTDVVNQARGNKKRAAPPPSVKITLFVKQSVLDPGDAVRGTIAVTAAAGANRKKHENSIGEGRERKLKKLMGLSADEELR